MRRMLRFTGRAVIRHPDDDRDQGRDTIFLMEEVMTSTLKLAIAAAFAATAFAGVASAENTIYTRSPEAAQADLVRDWSFNGSGTRGVVRQRTSSEMRADLVRDWDAKKVTAEENREIHSRNEKQAHDDLVRNWN
jgi:hypothetical protein